MTTRGTLHLLSFLSAIFLLSARAAVLSAQSDGLVLNEIYYDHPGSDEGWEFIELINAGVAAVDIGGCLLESLDGATGSSRPLWMAPEGTVLSPGDILLVGGDRRSGCAGTLADGSLQNGPDAVRLSINGAVIDIVGYGDGLPAELYEAAPCPDVDPGCSLARKPDGADTGDNSTDLVSSVPSPGWRNSFDVDISLSADELSVLRCEGDAVNIPAGIRNEGLRDFHGLLSVEEVTGGVSIWFSERRLHLTPGSEAEVVLAQGPTATGRIRLVLFAEGDENPRNDTLRVEVSVSPGPVLIDEIMYRPLEEGEWVELLGTGPGIVEISGWSLSDLSGRTCFFPSGLRLGPGQYIVAAEDSSAMAASGAAAVTGMEGTWPRLNNGAGEGEVADEVTLRDASGALVDRVSYPSMPEMERGRSVERISASSCSALGSEIWLRSQSRSGSTPGRKNSVTVPSPLPDGPSARPNPFSRCAGEEVRIYAPLAASERSARGTIWDLDGRMVRRLPAESGGAPLFTCKWDGYDDRGEPVRAGLYICVVDFVMKGGMICRREKVCIAVGCAR